MHGCAPGSGSQPGERHARFKHGRYSRKTKELGARMRGLAKAGEVLVATAMSRHGLKPPVALRRRKHVREALKGEQSNAGQGEHGGQGAPAAKNAEG